MKTVYPYNVQQLNGVICDSLKDVRIKLKDAELQYQSAVQLAGQYPGLPVSFSSELSVLSGKLSSQQQRNAQQDRDDWIKGCGYGSEMRDAKALIEDMVSWQERVRGYVSSPAYRQSQSGSGSSSTGISVLNPFPAESTASLPSWLLPAAAVVFVLGGAYLFLSRKK